MANILALITARGGSKSVPKKNIRLVAGKPLIAWTIEAAKSCKNLDRVVVSTDDEEIAQTAREWGAEVPFTRPPELAQNDSPHIPVVIHAVEWMESHEAIKSDYVLLLQPTSPLRSSQDIDDSIQLALEHDADSVVSVCEAPYHPYLAKNIVDGRLEDFMPPPEGYLARQTLPRSFVNNGAIYLVRRDILMERQTLYTDNSYAYVMPAERSLDIDTPWDLHLAQLILKDLGDPQTTG
jgi:CMP-N,N'-diacetyllegionaminic acid synthase